MKKLLWGVGAVLAIGLIAVGLALFLVVRVPDSSTPPGATAAPASPLPRASADTSAPDEPVDAGTTASDESPRRVEVEADAPAGSGSEVTPAAVSPAPGANSESDRPALDAAQRATVAAIAARLGVSDVPTDGPTYRLLAAIVARGEAEVPAADLAEILTSSMANAPDGRVFLAASEPLRVRYDGTRVEIGSVVDLQRLDMDALSENARTTVEKLRGYAPFLAERPIWVALESVPRASDGMVDLREGLALQLGELRVPAFLARALGLDQQLQESLLLDLQVLAVDALTVRDDRLFLRATPTLDRR